MRDHFGVIAAAGELATHFGITGWSPGTAAQGAETTFNCWLSARGEGIKEDQNAITAVAEYLQEAASKEFYFGSCWKQEVRGTECFCITSRAWKEDVCKGLDSAYVAEVLSRRGLLVEDAGRRQAKVRAPGDALMNVYAVKVSLLGTYS